MEFVRFIFSSFWGWLGFLVLVSMIGGGVIELAKACKPEKRRVEICRDADRLKVTIIGATVEEAKAAREEVVMATYNGYGYTLKKSGEERDNER